MCKIIYLNTCIATVLWHDVFNDVYPSRKIEQNASPSAVRNPRRCPFWKASRPGSSRSLDHGKPWQEWGYSELYMTYQQFEYVNMFFLIVFFTNWSIFVRIGMRCSLPKSRTKPSAIVKLQLRLGCSWWWCLVTPLVNYWQHSYCEAMAIEIVDSHIKHGDFNRSYVRLPEGHILKGSCDIWPDVMTTKLPHRSWGFSGQKTH